MKKLIFKLIQIFIILFIVGATALYFLTYPTVKKINSCYIESSKKVDNSIQTAKEENWKTEDACKFSLTIIEDLEQCLSEIEDDSPIPLATIFEITERFNKDATTPDKIRAIYNQFCDIPESK